MPHQQLAMAVQMCIAKQIRFTPIRQQVFLLMAEHKGAISAYDLLKKLQIVDSKAKPPTIYRALDFLLKNHFIHRIESLNAYFMCSHFGCAHPLQLLVCDQCKHVIELSDPVVDDSFLMKASELGFEITNKVLEAHGVCRRCLNNEHNE